MPAGGTSPRRQNARRDAGRRTSHGDTNARRMPAGARSHGDKREGGCRQSAHPTATNARRMPARAHVPRRQTRGRMSAGARPTATNARQMPASAHPTTTSAPRTPVSLYPRGDKNAAYRSDKRDRRPRRKKRALGSSRPRRSTCGPPMASKACRWSRSRRRPVSRG